MGIVRVAQGSRPRWANMEAKFTSRVGRAPLDLSLVGRFPNLADRITKKKKKNSWAPDSLNQNLWLGGPGIGQVILTSRLPFGKKYLSLRGFRSSRTIFSRCRTIQHPLGGMQGSRLWGSCTFLVCLPTPYITLWEPSLNSFYSKYINLECQQPVKADPSASVPGYCDSVPLHPDKRLDLSEASYLCRLPLWGKGTGSIQSPRWPSRNSSKEQSPLPQVLTACQSARHWRWVQCRETCRTSWALLFPDFHFVVNWRPEQSQAKHGKVNAVCHKDDRRE